LSVAIAKLLFLYENSCIRAVFFMVKTHLLTSSFSPSWE
jgi:hypothetical protein